MNEKILALLAEKFAQARKDGLQQLARSLALQVSDETQAQALVEQITPDKVTDYIKEWRREVPDNFKGWVNDNKERIDNAKQKPYFLLENEKLIKAAK